MKFFSGFCFRDEYPFFKDIITQDIINNDYVVSGFSFGAIEALDYALCSSSRIDRLILLSPSFFNNKDGKFVKLQLMGYRSNKEKYQKTFLQNIKSPLMNKMSLGIDDYFYSMDKENGLAILKKMLEYKWSQKDLELLNKKNILLEVYLGGRDIIIDAHKAKDFFIPYGDVYMINNANHILVHDKY